MNEVTLRPVLHADIATTRALYSTAHDMARRLISRCVGASKSGSVASSPGVTAWKEHAASALSASPISVQVHKDTWHWCGETTLMSALIPMHHLL